MYVVVHRRQAPGAQGAKMPEPVPDFEFMGKDGVELSITCVYRR
jgi:hypothetical protein